MFLVLREGPNDDTNKSAGNPENIFSSINKMQNFGLSLHYNDNKSCMLIKYRIVRI